MTTRITIRQVLFLGLFCVACPSPHGLAQSQPLNLSLLEKPDAFETLINPNCSHCVDEARRRGGELKPTERVLSWIRGKYDGGAIPLRFFLSRYRVISDTYGVFVYDPDAGFVRGFEPSLDFKFHGWRNGIMVMKHADGTLYSALSGRAFAGPRKGDQLKPVATLETDWGAWLDRYPDTVAYHMFDTYQPVELPAEENLDSVGTRSPPDSRLFPFEEVLGVALDGQSRAYPLKLLELSNGLIVDQFAGRNVVVLWNKATRTAAIYAPDVAFGDSIRALNLAVEPSRKPENSARPSLELALIDQETGSRWDITGRAVAGALKGQSLQWLPGVQCRWFAWAAEYPESDIYAPADNHSPDDDGNHGDGGDTPDEQKNSRADDGSPNPVRVGERSGPAKPLEGVIVRLADVTSANLAAWKRDGRSAIVVVLDETADRTALRECAVRLASARVDLYYWIEVARNRTMADAHPHWMSSLGQHRDWQRRFPGVPTPAEGREVAKAYPWVPIGYRETFDAHLSRITELLRQAAEPYRGLLLNDLQGGPASCGCGNLQCRWALDYGVPSTAELLKGDDVARRFIDEVRKLAAGKDVIPVWMTECEHDDLPARLRNGAETTGLCGSVPCATGICPKVFARQWSSLVSAGDSPVGLLVLQKELERTGPRYAGSPWISKAVEYIDTIPALHGEPSLTHDRLWVIVQGHGVPAREQAATRAAALKTQPAAVLIAETPLDQSYEPRVIRVP